MAKVAGKFDTRNPFIPAQSKVCRVADTYLVASALVSSLTACAVTLYRLFVE